MWVKLLIYTKDTVYAKRLADYLDKEYGDKTEIKVISDIEQVVLYSQDADVILADEQYESEITEAVKKREIGCLCIYLVEKNYENQSDIPTLFKYQRGDLLYKAILEIYSTHGNVRVSQKHSSDSGCKVFAFLSPYGGVGTTTVAKAFAKKNAVYEKVLYLNLQPLNVMWGEEKENGLDDIIMALKSRRSILPLKLQSAVEMNKDHVFCFAPSKNPMDILELTAQDMENLIQGIRDLNIYQKVVLDIGTYFTEKEIELLKLADSIVCVVDNAEVNVAAYEKFVSLLQILQVREKCRLVKKVELFKNKVLGGTENGFEQFGLKTGGWAPFVKMNANEDVIERIAQSDSFESLGLSYAD